TVTCDVNVSGTHQGALIVTSSTCLAPGAHVNGAVLVKPGGALDVEGSTITGAIDATQGAAEIRVCGSTIRGAVDVTNSGGLVLVGDPADGCAPNVIGGALDVQGNMHGVEVVDNTVGGAILTDGNSGPGPLAGEATTISGNHPPPLAPPVVPGPPPPPAGNPGASETQGAPQQAAPSGSSGTVDSATPTSVGIPSPATPGAATITSPPKPRVVVPAKRLTQAQKLAAAIHACNKLAKAKQRSCIATARGHFPGATTKTKPRRPART
ncbi:MAG: hypothetical protein QOE44_484, partial [Solirubrobacteraceae bacterium]|nr:hypothetical protein [Solirubrobacteraceae bacterium]